MQSLVRTQTATGNSSPICFDHYKTPFSVAITVAISGTANVTVQVTEDDPQGFGSEALFQANATWLNHATLATITATASGVISSAVKAARTVVNSISSGNVVSTYLQAG